MYEYLDRLQLLTKKAISTNEEQIKKVIDLISDAITSDRVIHTFGTGHSHMIGLELFIRAGGLANINAVLDSSILTNEGAIRSSKLERISGIADVLYDQINVSEGDLFIVISNSGRNAVPIEFAQRAKRDGHIVVVLTSLEQSKNYPSRHTSGLKLYQIGDIILDNCVPTGDGIFEIDGAVTGPASSIIGMSIMNTIVYEAMKKSSKAGVRLPIYSSQNVDGYNNDDLYNKYRNRIKLI